MPASCHIELEPKAREIVLDSIRNAIPSNWPAKVAELKELASEGHDSLSAFLEHSELELEDVYDAQHSWSDLREAAGLPVEPHGPNERSLRRACGRLLHVDDIARITAYRDLLQQNDAPRIDSVSARDARVARMLVASVCGSVLNSGDSLNAGLALLWKHPQVKAELIELMNILEEKISHHHEGLLASPEVPLQIHARYTRLEILAAFDPEDKGQVPTWQTGVRWLPKAQADLLAFTLDKTSGQFSPTTRYRDFAISPNRIHWESQGVTRADSNTGLRYQNHVALGSKVMLFARERADDRAFWFLGLTLSVCAPSRRETNGHNLGPCISVAR